MVNTPSAPIDYTNLGFESLRQAMLALARERLPEWTDQSANDLGVLLVDLFAYACDITLYYQTRIAANLLPATADEPDALVQLLRLIGYEMLPAAPATADLEIAIDAATPLPIAVPARTQFFAPLPSGAQLIFETERDLLIRDDQLTPADARNLRRFFPLPVVQGQTQTDNPVAFADGSPNQMYPLRQPGVIAGSVQVTVVEPGGAAARWQEVETLADSGPADRHFVVQRDAAGVATLLFGDGVNSMIPPRGSAVAPVAIIAVYRTGGGAEGNVPARTSFRPGLGTIIEAVNPQPAAGGMPAESIERARSFAPRLFRTQERAVTAQDYVELALQMPGVGKARAVALNWNEVLLYVAPSGAVAAPSELLVRDLLAFFESRRMVTAGLTVVGPRPADIYLRADVQAQPYYRQVDVEAAVEAAVAGYLAFEAVEFGQPVYLSRVYDAIQSLPQVVSVFISEFSRIPGAGAVQGNGVIELSPEELPRPGYRDNPATPPDPLRPAFRPPIAVSIRGGAA